MTNHLEIMEPGAIDGSLDAAPQADSPLPAPPGDGATADSGDAAGVAISAGERVLLIEDDETFETILEEFFLENGYAVVAVKNGAEAMKELLTTEFAIILCDVNLPTLRGDEFYRVVARVWPHLRSRFVFMTGHRTDQKIADFIREVKGRILHKPFQLDALLNVVCAIETCRRFEESKAARLKNPEPGVAAEPAPVRKAERPAAPRPEPRVEKPAAVAKPAIRPAEAAPAPVDAPPAVEQPPAARSRLVGTMLWVALAMTLVVIPVSDYLDLRSRVAATTIEVSERAQQWEGLSNSLKNAEEKRLAVESAAARAEQLVQEADAPRWIHALRSVAASAGENVELRSIRARGAADELAAWHLRIQGVCIGREPRATAERFRQALEADLGSLTARGGVTARFVQLEDEALSAPLPAGGQKRRAAFTIVATAGEKAHRTLEEREK